MDKELFRPSPFPPFLRQTQDRLWPGRGWEITSGGHPQAPVFALPLALPHPGASPLWTPLAQQPAGTLQLIDSHAHLESLEDLEEALQKAVAVGVVAVVAVGSGYESNLQVLELAQRWKPWVYPALGLHPWELGTAQVDQVLHLIEEHITQAVGIGEIGLDYDRRVKALAGVDRQQAVFRELLGLARKHGKPALIHSRYAWKDAFDLAREVGVEKAVFHWYTGLPSVLREIIAQGYLISATPAAEYHAEHRRAIREAPLGSLLLETDCPVTYGRETRYTSRPADLLRSLRAVAQLKGVVEVVVAEETTRNALAFFDLPEGS